MWWAKSRFVEADSWSAPTVLTVVTASTSLKAGLPGQKS